MCSSAKIGRQTASPGSHMIINFLNGSDVKPWGIREYYNARVENINNFWRDYKFCYTQLSSFFEGNKEFQLKNSKQFSKLFKVASLYNEDGFVILTRPATKIVKPYHHRQPIILLMPDLFIEKGQIIEIDYANLVLTA